MRTSAGRIRSWFLRTGSGLTGRLPGVRAAGRTVDGRTSATGTDDSVAAGSESADRGDVPGWVLVTLMTAGLVSALWLGAGKALVNLCETAISHGAP